MNEMQKMLQQMADLRRRMNDMVKVGTVKEVYGDKMRVVIGKDSQGQEVLSPWMNTANHRGKEEGSQERRRYVVGQNVSLLNAVGDTSQGMVIPYAPSTEHKAPDHASESGEGEETYQYAYQRSRDLPNGKESYLAAKKDAKDSKDAKVMVRMGEENPKKDAEPKGEYTVTAKEKIIFKVDDSNRIEITPAGVKIYGKRIDWNP